VRLEARTFVIATGSVVAPPVVPGLVEAGYVDSDAVLDSANVPKSIVVLGGGYVGQRARSVPRAHGREDDVPDPRGICSRPKTAMWAIRSPFISAQEGIDVRSGAQLVPRRSPRRPQGRALHARRRAEKRRRR
jgi:mercuric reductase